jgi:hypothetical protein
MALVFVDPTQYDQLENDHHHPTEKPNEHYHGRNYHHQTLPRPSKVIKPMTTALALPTPTAITAAFVHDLKDMIIGRSIPACKKHHSNYYYKLNDKTTTS